MRPSPTRPPSPLRIPRAGVALILLLSCAVALGCGSRNGAERQPVFRQVKPPVAFEMLRDYPGLPVLDVRPREEYHGPLGHLRGAVSAPANDLPRLIRDLAWLHGETFLVYCHADECDPQVLDFLHGEGFHDAMLIHGGIQAWVDDGFGTVGVGDPPEHEDDADLSGPRDVEGDDSDDIF